MMKRKTRGLTASVLMLLGLACNDPRDDEPDSTVATVVTPSVELRDGRVWLDLPKGGQLAALRQLAKTFDFKLELHSFRPRPAALQLEGVALADAVAALVGDTSFTFEYVFDIEHARHEIAVLHIGASSPSSAPTDGHHGDVREARSSSSAVGPARDPEPLPITNRSLPREPQPSSRVQIELARERVTALHERLRRARGGDDQRELEDEYVQATDDLQAQFRQALSDPDPVIREEMLEEVEIDSGDARDRIGMLAQTDPNPRVRAAAAETLGDDGTFQSVAELIGMLDDHEPSVLMATLEALDQSGDESLQPYLTPLSNHPDSQVREMANEMLEFWE